MWDLLLGLRGEVLSFTTWARDFEAWAGFWVSLRDLEFRVYELGV